MIIQDKQYGEINITEPVIQDLINSPSLQRLKQIDQAGFFEPYFPGTAHSRLEHSIGCYHLLKKFGASLEEQICGLLHDVSHSAFSHCIDYVLDEGSETHHDHQDNIFLDFVRTTEIPSILEKYELNVEYIINEHNFPLQERDLPEICADRLDYSFRSAIAYAKIDKKLIDRMISNLRAQDNQWFFNDYKIGREYAELFRSLNNTYWSNIETAVMFRTVGDYLKYALNKNYISKDALYTTDKEVINRINKNLHIDLHLTKLWERMNSGKDYENNPDKYDAKVSCKSRLVNPLVLDGRKLVRVSDIDPGWGKIVEEESRPKIYYLKFLENL